jgi:hypothetical protein
MKNGAFRFHFLKIRDEGFMSNLLTNPTLAGFSLGRYFTEQGGQVGTIENPSGWEFICYPRASDPNKLPQSLHRDRGFVIAAGFRAWEGGYVQKGIQIEANQRYLMKAHFKPDINFSDSRVDLTAITWRFRVVSSNGQTLEQDWGMTSKDRFKQDEEASFIFYSAEAQTVDFYFMARSVYAGNVADFNVYSLSLEPVEETVGATHVPTLGTSTISTATSRTAATPPPTPIITSPLIGNTSTPNVSATIAGPSGKDLGSVLSAEEIDTIALGLRSLAKQVNPIAGAGLNKLAEGLERLK